MKVSFVIPTFNCAAWLPHAVASVQAQDHPDWECVIVDDASTDQTPQYLDWLAGKNSDRFKIVSNPKNLGRSESRNIGNQRASGALILVLDADDLATPNRASLTIRKFRDTGAQYLYGAATIIDPLGQELGVMGHEPYTRKGAKDTLLNGIVHSTASYTPLIAEKYPYRGGDIAALGIDDWAQQTLIFGANEKTAHIPQKLAAYRLLNSGISQRRDEEKVKAAKLAFLTEKEAVPA